MTRSPLVLAALASAGVPGLEPVTAWGPPGAPGDHFDLAFVTDQRGREWVVRSPCTEADGATLEASQPLLKLLNHRLPFEVPRPAGFARIPQGRAVTYPRLGGQPIDLAQVPEGPGLAGALGRALGAIHNLDRALYEEAGMPSYDAEAYRLRRLAEVDRAAATGHVPTGLLTRWEAALEDVAMWRFAAAPTHGALTGDRILVSFAAADDASTGMVSGITGWEHAKIADPADDWAAIVSQCPPEVIDGVRDGYRHVLVERADPHLLVRAHLAAELTMARRLLAAADSGDVELVEGHAALLRQLDQERRSHPDDPLSNHLGHVLDEPTWGAPDGPDDQVVDGVGSDPADPGGAWPEQPGTVSATTDREDGRPRTAVDDGRRPAGPGDATVPVRTTPPQVSTPEGAGPGDATVPVQTTPPQVPTPQGADPGDATVPVQTTPPQVSTPEVSMPEVSMPEGAAPDVPEPVEHAWPPGAEPPPPADPA